MLESSRFIDKFLQNYRFSKVKSFLIGDVLDFGGNRGELQQMVGGKYLVVEQDHSVMNNTHFDTIVCLAVVEHMAMSEVFGVFDRFKKVLNRNGRIILTTPTKMAKPVLEFMALLKIIDRASVAEHKHYWTKKEIYILVERAGFVVKKYQKFQLGFNQLAFIEHK